MKAVIISLGLFNHTGGPTKTIDNFKCALDAELYAFCEQHILKKHKLSIEGAYPVISSSLPVFSQFCYTQKGIKEAKAAIQKSDIVSCHGFYRYHALWTHKVCTSTSVPYWFVPHGILDPWVIQKSYRIKKLYWKLGGQRFLQDASTVIFSTCAERDKAASQFNLPEAEVIPWPVNIIDLSDREVLRFQIRKKLNISEEARILLYFGRLHSMKRPLETIEAVARASAEKTHLVIVGNEHGITKANCMQRARKYGLEKYVHFVGPVYGEEKYHYMHAADAYISLSYRENFNHAAAESIAAGLPVILSPGNDLRSELSDVGCCIDIEDNSLKSAVKAIQGFCEISPSKLRDMGLLGRKWVEEHLNFDLFKSRLIELHKKHAKGHS